MKIRSLLIGMLASIALVGCTNDDESPLVEEQEVAVSFALNAEGAMDSRAISDGKGANTLMYAVFEEGATTPVIPKSVINNVKGLTDAGGYSFQLSLLKGRTYQVVFWAQNSKAIESGFYSVDENMNVTVNYAGLNNDETRDAFFASQKVEVKGNSNVSVTLKRPFAQINVGALITDYKYAADQFGIKVDQSYAEIKNVPNKINLLDGKVDGNETVLYDFGAIPTEENILKVDVDGIGGPEDYKWVSMSYILAAQHDVDTSTKHNMKFIFRQEKKQNSDISFELTDVPAKRNYRTNIVGQVFSSRVNVNVKIDSMYDGEMLFAGPVEWYFNTDTKISNTEFAFNNSANHNWAWFTTTGDQKLEFDNVVFSGKVYHVAIGTYTKSTNATLNNVRANNVTVGNCVTSEKDCMSVLFMLHGNISVNNCEWKGTTTEQKIPIIGDSYTYEGATPREDNVAYDCGVANGTVAEFNKCKFGSMYVWAQSYATLTNCTVDYLRAATLHYTNTIQGRLTIGEGTTVDVLDVTTISNYRVTITIKNGATVNKLNFKHSKNIQNNYFIIEPGAKVNGKVFEEGMSIKEFLGLE